ncbi:MAG: 4-hydroxy-tetrahydrodipicolinate synthase [Syntrophomonadaceae bacterium]|jgi:4-hydroxy-tetrahydrodipicolinate synthase|nr:4-hydroxy-tetrahydrodipicolinate synthase [Syntrophomonadaceae bacterium]
MAVPRLMTAMVTPFNADLSVNYAKAAELAEYLCNNGSEGLVVCGTTGESPVLSDEEKLKLYETVQERVGGRVPVWAGTGCNDTAAVVKLSQAAAKIGVAGVMVVTPYYNKPTQEGLYQHFRTVAESVSVPVMLYNVPGRTSCNLLPETIARLAEVENITAVKEACGSMDQVSQLLTMIPERITVYSGDDSVTLPLMALGAYGVISVASHVIGPAIAEMIAAFVAGEVNKAAQLHRELFAMFKGLFITTNPIPVKTALNMLGHEVGGFRLPLTPAAENEQEFMRALLKRYNLL